MVAIGGAVVVVVPLVILPRRCRPVLVVAVFVVILVLPLSSHPCRPVLLVVVPIVVLILSLLSRSFVSALPDRC